MTVRDKVLDALRIHDRSQIVEIGTQKVLKVLYRALSCSSPIIQERAAILLGEIGDQFAIAFLQRLWREADPSALAVRVAAKKAIVKLDPCADLAGRRIDRSPWNHDIYVPKSYLQEEEDDGDSDKEG